MNRHKRAKQTELNIETNALKNAPRIQANGKLKV